MAETSFQESQLVTNTMSATYSNTLLLNRAPEAVVGSYGCSVRNSRGSSGLTTLELQGMHVLLSNLNCMKFFTGLQIIGFVGRYFVGDNVSISCSTDLTFSRIVWLDADGEELLVTITGQLRLGVTADLDGAQFTCRAESVLGNQERTIIMTVVSTGGLCSHRFINRVIQMGMYHR